MIDVKLDLRIVKTRTKIKNAVIEAFKGNYLTSNMEVSKLCEMAKLNRTTFYKHYTCIDDVLTDMFHDIAMEIMEILYANKKDLGLAEHYLQSYFTKNATRIKCVLYNAKMYNILVMHTMVEKFFEDIKYFKKEKNRSEYPLKVYYAYADLFGFVTNEKGGLN